jgi:hypothetical protein
MAAVRGSDAGGQHDVVEAAGLERSASTRRLSCRVDAAGFDAAAEVAQRLGEFLLAGDALGEVELAADLVGGLEQRDLRGRARRRWWRRPGRPGRRRPRRPLFGAAAGDDQLGLVAGARVDQAGGQLAVEDVVEAGLVAGDAGVDLVGAAGAALFTKSASARKGRAIDTMSASPAASTSSATSGVLMRLVVISGIFTSPFMRAVTQAKAARGTIVAMVGMRASCQPMPVLMIVAPAASMALRELHHFVPGAAALDQVEHRQAEDDDEVRADARACAHDLDGEADAVLEGAAPLGRRAGWSAAR